jgi:hypothetical protein
MRTPRSAHQARVAGSGRSSASQTSKGCGKSWASIASSVSRTISHGSLGAFVTTIAVRRSGTGSDGSGRFMRHSHE